MARLASRFRLPRNWHAYLWALPALVFLFVALGSLGPSSYFLHFDTPVENLRAADLADGCWGTGGTKPILAFILTPFFLLGGDSPYWEPLVVTLLGMLTMALLFQLTVRLTGSRRWALLGTLWFISLPTILYYTRLHVGYPLALFVLGLWLYTQQRYPLAGLAFGAAIVSHVSFLLPVAAWLGWSILLGERPGRVRTFVEMGAFLLLPYVVVESVYFFFDGMVLGWTRGTWGDITRISAQYVGGDWPDVWRVVAFANGPLNALLLFSGLVYPAVRQPRLRLMDAVYLSGWSTIVFWVLDVGLTGGAFRHRMMAGAYPLLAIGATFTLMRLTARLTERLSASWERVVRVAGASAVLIALPLVLVNATLDALVGSRTAYDVMDAVMADAADAGLAVRYYGNLNSSRFLARRNHVEIVVNETEPDIVAGDTQAVLIFEDTGQPMRAKLLAYPGFDPALYEVSSYPHFVRYKPRIVETSVTAPQLREFRQLPFARAPGSQEATTEIWWPVNPSGTFGARHRVNRESQVFILHYPGSGCVSPKRFDGDTRNYYEILFEKAAAVAQAVAAGDFDGARGLIESALGDGKIGDFSFETDGG